MATVTEMERDAGHAFVNAVKAACKARDHRFTAAEIADWIGREARIVAGEDQVRIALNNLVAKGVIRYHSGQFCYSVER